MPRLIAIDLGAHAAKVAIYTAAGRKYRLDGRFHQEVPQDGEVSSLEARLAALDALIDDEPQVKARAGDVVVTAIPASRAAMHRIVMPFSDRAQIERALPFAVENEVPFELSDMVMGWRIGEGKTQAQVMVGLARHDVVEQWVAGLVHRGLDPAFVTVSSEVFGRWGNADGPTEVDAAAPLVALVDLGHAQTEVSVVRNGNVQWSRAINVGGLAFTRAIQQTLGCSFDDAEAVKHGEIEAPGGVLQVDPEEVTQELVDPGRGDRFHSGYGKLPAQARQAVDDAIGLLLAEVRSTLIQAEDTLAGEITEVRVCGGSSRIDEIWGYLAQDLGVPVRRASDPAGDTTPPEFALAQALASCGMPGVPAPVDLRIGDLAFRGRTDLLRSVLKYGVVGTVAYTFAGLALSTWYMVGMWREQMATEAAVIQMVTTTFPEIGPDTLTSMDAAEAMMRGETEDMVRRAEVLGEGSGGLPPTVDALARLTAAFPPHPDVTVELSDLSISRKTMSFTAETDGFAASAAIEEKLKEIPEFAQASKGQETRLNDGRVRFPITIPLGDPTPEEG